MYFKVVLAPGCHAVVDITGKRKHVPQFRFLRGSRVETVLNRKSGHTLLYQTDVQFVKSKIAKPFAQTKVS